MEEREQRMRLAAFAHVQRLSSANGGLTGRQLTDGFSFEGEYIPLVLAQRGISKPRQMQHLLSLRTAWPNSGSFYADQRSAHNAIFSSAGTIDYDFMRGGPDKAPNRWLREAWELELPVIYFLAAASAFYQAFLPVWVVGWDPHAGAYGQAKLAFGLPGDEGPAVRPAPRRAGLAAAQRQLRKANFRELVADAYMWRCAISGEGGAANAAARERSRRLLAVADLDSAGEPRAAAGGLLLTKLHRSAYEADLIGIDADYRVHASPRLLAEPSNAQYGALSKIDGARLRPPRRAADYPDRDLLAARFEQFRRTH